jgi:hypothetical protein
MAVVMRHTVRGCVRISVVEEIEPVLAPKHLAIEDIARRPDDFDRNGVSGVLFILCLGLLALSFSQKFCARKFFGVGNAQKRGDAGQA